MWRKLLSVGPVDLNVIFYSRRIARNILLLTLIVDGLDDAKITLCWNLYYHFRVDKISLELLRTQARKLCSLSAKDDRWSASAYGQLITFCDPGTLARVRQMWTFYAAYSDLDSDCHGRGELEAAIQRAKKRKDDMGKSVNMTAIRSALPAFDHSISDLSILHQHYWDHGVIDLDKPTLSRSTLANPMFSTPDRHIVLHYGTDPLLGFHLATAFAPLDSESYLYTASKHKTGKQRMIETTRAQFKAWATSFSAQWHSVTLRFFVGDALAFGHALQHRAGLPKPPTADFHRDHFRLEPVVLDVHPRAPSKFLVIDTSNLIDHLGSINLLVAASPLLLDDASASLYTEKLVFSEAPYRKLLDSLLCGDLSTIAMLLRLTLADLVMNTSDTPAESRTFLGQIDKVTNNGKPTSGQLFVRMNWKRPLRQQPSPVTAQARIKLDTKALANLLYGLYMRMFENEDITTLMSKVNTLKMKQFAIPVYQRASYAIFIRAVKVMVDVDWQQTISLLMGSIESNTSHIMTMNYIQELYTWLHLLDLYSVSILRETPHYPRDISVRPDLRTWRNVPSVVSVTLVVPRDKITSLTGRDVADIGTNALQCVIQGSSDGRPWQNIFAAVQIGFGKLTSSGTYHEDSFALHVAEDESSWNGKSDIIVCFFAPTWTLMQKSSNVTIALSIQPTPQSTRAFIKTLGLELTIYTTNLSDENHVFMSKNLPNLSTLIGTCFAPARDSTQPDDNHDAALTSFVAGLSTGASSIISMTGRIDLVSAASKTTLQAGSEVELVAKSPFNLTVNIGSSLKVPINFPMAVNTSNVKTRIARKSGYLELICQPADSSDWAKTHCAFYPVMIDAGHISLWNLPYLKLQSLPRLDITQKENLRQWFTPHTSLMFSAREKYCRENPSSKRTHGEQVRLDFKDSLFSIFMHLSGLQGMTARVFGISCPTAGGVHILIFVSSLRLDLSNRSTVLDAAVVPLYDAVMPRIMPAIQSLTSFGLCQVKASEAEMQVWKQALPAYTERCRSWSHKSTCQYKRVGKAPLSVEKGERVICSCGEGVIPAGFMPGLPNWKDMMKYATRAAITPCFSAEMIAVEPSPEEITRASTTASTESETCKSCGKDKKADGSSLMVCSRCHQVKYCSPQCQRSDWKNHKHVCEAN